MRANRYTALIDANVLVGALTRNLLLSLAEAGLFRARWSEDILQETEKALVGILKKAGEQDPGTRSKRHCDEIRKAFPESSVMGYDDIVPSLNLPDPKDRHVLAAAIVARAAVIVTENIKDFPKTDLEKYEISASSCDSFIADVIDLNQTVSFSAIRRMRERFKRPDLDPEALIVRMESLGLTETSNILINYVDLI